MPLPKLPTRPAAILTFPKGEAARAAVRSEKPAAPAANLSVQPELAGLAAQRFPEYAEHVAEVTDLDKPQAEGKEESDPDQQVNEHGSPHQVVNHCNQGVHNSLVVITSMVSLR